MNKLPQAQEAVAASDLDAWLLYDFRGSNPLLRQLLGASPHSTRRVFLYVPRSGEPVFLVHQVDAGHFPGDGLTIQPYQDRENLLGALKELLRGKSRVAMEYSPMGALPTLSHVDGGTLELVRSFGVTVESSAELAQYALCRLTPDELASHRRAATTLGEIVHQAFAHIGKHVGHIQEHEVAEFIRQRFVELGLVIDAGPIVAVNAHAGDPHYEPLAPDSSMINRGDWVLIDLWAKEPGGIYGDITWTAFVGESPSADQRRVFDIVTSARDAAIAFLQQEVAAGRFPVGATADEVARKYIEEAGYGPQFTHRLGHSLGDEVHGYGANLDSFETQETRRLVPGLAFTIEPGVYLPTFGVRSEVDLYMTAAGPEITTPVQREIVLI